MNNPSTPLSRFMGLLRTIHDGTASIPCRLMVSLVGGLFLSGVTSVACFIFAAMFPPAWVRNPSYAMPPNTVRVSDEVALSCFLTAGAVYLLFLVWVWSRHRRKLPIWSGTVKTVGVVIGSILLCVLLAENFNGDEEFLVLGVLLAAGAVIILIWYGVYQQTVRGRPLYAQEGLVDLRCPHCQYRMVGLKEARCPECGQEYTLDELVRKQDFDALRAGMSPVEPPANVSPANPPPPAPPIPPLPPHASSV